MKTESEKEIIRSSYGEVFRELRRKKHISQKVAAGGKHLQGNLSRFEQGGLIPATDTFFKYLRNIKVDPPEYFNALNDYLIDKDILLYLNEVSTAYTSQNVPKLKEIIKELENNNDNGESSSNFDKSFLDRIMVEAILSLLDLEFKIPKSDADKIRNYLRATQYWGYYELRLLGCASRLFDFVQLAEISRHVFSFASKNEISPYISRQIILCELNILDSFLLQKQLKQAKIVISNLEKYNIPENFYYERATLTYFEARYDYLCGNNQARSLDKMKAHLSALELYGCSGIARLCREEIDNLVNDPDVVLFPYDREDEGK
ncbi:Rgg/GadR/MutR family transcriptional regulator [Lactovum odontotermitis]